MSNLNSDNLKGDLGKLVSGAQQDVAKVETGILATLSRYWYWVALACFVAGAVAGHFI